MTRDEAWKWLMKKYPDFQTNGVHFTAKGLKDFFNWAWLMAENDTVQRLRGDADFPEVLNQLFGEGRKG